MSDKPENTPNGSTDRGSGSSEDTGEHIAHNSLFATISSLADALLLVLLILAGRLLGPEDFGHLAFALAISTIILFTTNLGLDSVAIRKIAVNTTDAARVIGSVLAWKLGLSIMAFSFFTVGISLFIDSLALHVTYILAIAGVLRSFNRTMRCFLQAHEHFRTESLVVLTERLLLLVGGTAVLMLTHSLIALAVVFPIARIIAFLFFAYRLSYLVPISQWNLELPLALHIQRQALPLGAATILMGLYIQIDVLIISAFLSSSAVGLYASAYRIYEGLMAVPPILITVFYPRLSALASSDPTRHTELFNRAIKYILVLGMPVIVIGLTVSSPLIELIYGPRFTSASNTLALLLTAAALLFVYLVTITAHRAIGREYEVMIANGLGLLTKIMIGILLIPYIGMSGAAIAALVSTLVMLGHSVYTLHRYGYEFMTLRTPLTKLVFAALMMGGIILLFREHAVLLVCIISGCSYLLTLLPLRMFESKELAIARRVLLRRAESNS